MNRPKSTSRLLAGRSRSRSSVITTTTSTINGNGNGKATERNGRATSARRDDKLPSLAKINREIMDKSAELLGQKGMAPQILVEWIADKRGDYWSQFSSVIEQRLCLGKLCCIYMKFDEDKSTPAWHPYRYQVLYKPHFFLSWIIQHFLSRLLIVQ